MRKIEHATRADAEEILALYRTQLGRQYCPWTEEYPTMDEIDFDLDRDSLFIQVIAKLADAHRNLDYEI